MTQSMDSFQAKATAAESCEMLCRLDWMAGPPRDEDEIYFLFIYLFLQENSLQHFISPVN